MEDYLEIGKIANTHGVKGELKVIPLTDNPERYDVLKWVYVGGENDLEKYDIENVKYTRGMVIVKFKEVNDMDSAERMKGLYLKVDRKNAVKLPKDAFFICDLIECDVYEENGNNLGKIKDVLKTGSNDVYLVKDGNNREILIPALKSVVTEVSIENKKIVVKLPEGVVDNEI